VTTRAATTFSLRYSVTCYIGAPPREVWSRLTNASEFPSWNSTVTRIDGEIAQGHRLAIRVPVAPTRTFRVTVVELVAERRMVWRDGFYPMFRGTRTFSLAEEGQGTSFTMEEVFEGLMLPMIRGSLPDFEPVFDRYAADLKAVCERGS
jgi:uncharacterized protein YndB with AHSA1/START domain